MQDCVKEYINREENSALLLVDIGVWPFHDLIKAHPERVRNIGIFEPGIISLAAGLSISGINPIVYGISPFIVQRALEQIKLDFAYQEVAGNLITTGASYDFSTLGYSHFCPEDVSTLRSIPGIEIITPGTSKQFISLWNSSHANDKLTYFRLTDYCNKSEYDVTFGKATLIKKGNCATVVTAAETLDAVIGATKDLDVTILYYTTMVPFDEETLSNELCGNKVFVCTPFYEGTMIPSIVKAICGQRCAIREKSVPLEITRKYGTKIERDEYYGLTVDGIRSDLLDFLSNCDDVSI